MNDWVFIHPWAHFAAHFWILGNVTRFRLLFCCRECYAFVFDLWDDLYFSSPSYTTLLRCRVLIEPPWGDGYLPVLTQTEFPNFAFFFKKVAFIGLIKGFHSDVIHFVVLQGEQKFITLNWTALSMMKSLPNIRSFHSSTMMRTPPVQNALHSPLILLEPQVTRQVLGRQWFGALSGKRGSVLWEIIETTFLWMSELKAETSFNAFLLISLAFRLCGMIRVWS